MTPLAVGAFVCGSAHQNELQALIECLMSLSSRP
jgi:hypothetical protein